MQWMGLEARYGSQRAEQESISIHMQSPECVSAQRAGNIVLHMLTASLHRELRSLSTHIQRDDSAVTQN
jgi:hypothetical protein